LVHELLGMLGLFGGLWSAAQGLPLELGTLAAATWTPAALAPFLGFGLSMFLFYSLVPYELRWGGAALLNISLLASDLWTALARYLYFGARRQQRAPADLPASPRRRRRPSGLLPVRVALQPLAPPVLAGGFPGSTLLFFLAALAIVAAGILLFTWSGDVDTALGAGSGDAAPSSALPVLYQPVPGHERRPLPSLSSKDAAEALRQVHLEQQQGQGAAGHGGANPFDVGKAAQRLAGRGGGHAGGFMPLPATDEQWPAPEAGAAAGDGDTPKSPAALGVLAPPGTAEPAGTTGLRPPSLELQRSPTLGSL
jgi:hypothetical protein